jgi:hypothetical protein
MADQNAVRIAIAEETTFGVAPVTGTLYKYVRFTSEGFKPAGESIQSGELDSDRQAQGSNQVSVNSEGSLNCELSLKTPNASAPANGYDSLIEGVMMNTWQDPADIAQSALDIDVISASSVSFTLQGQSPGDGAFANVVAGQWIKAQGWTGQTAGTGDDTIYAYVVSQNDSSTVVCTGCTNTGAEVVDEDGSGINITGSVARTGTLKKSYSVQKEMTDWSPVEYSHGTGLRIGQLEFGVTSKAYITMAFQFLGKLMATSTVNTITVSPTSVVAKWTTERVTSSSHVPLRFEGGFNHDAVRSSGGATSAPRMTNLGFTLNNGLSVQDEIGAGLDGPGDIGLGNPTIEGTLEIYGENGAIMRKAEGNTFSKVAWLIDDGSVQWMITVPRLKYRPSYSMEAGANGQPLLATFEWDAETDANGVSFQIDRMS